MVQLQLIRHGQASLMAQDYDQLSDLGQVQARALGQHLLSRPTPQGIWVGPRRRQQQTWEQVRGCFEAAGKPLPAPTTIAELDEHAGQQVFFQVIATLQERAPKLNAALNAALEKAQASAFSDRGALLGALALALGAWANGEVTVGDSESFASFRVRVRQAMSLVTAAAHGVQWVFTSAGVIAAAVGDVFGLLDEASLALGFEVDNASVTELQQRSAADASELADAPSGLRLKRFNQVCHLTPDQVTDF